MQGNLEEEKDQQVWKIKRDFRDEAEPELDLSFNLIVFLLRLHISKVQTFRS